MELKPLEIIEGSYKYYKKNLKMLEHPYSTYALQKFVLPLMKFFEKNNDDSLSLKLRHLFNAHPFHPAEARAFKHGISASCNSLERMLYCAKNNIPVVWTAWPVPSEIVRSFGVDTLSPMIFGVLSTTLDQRIRVTQLEESENMGLSSDICALNRLSLAANNLGQLPSPFAMISVSNPCDSEMVYNEIFSYYHDVPHFVLDFPYGKDKDSVDILENNTWDMIRFLEKLTGNKLDEHKLKDIAESVNKINYYVREINNFHRSTPCPNLTRFIKLVWSFRIIGIEEPELLTMVEEFYDIAKKRALNPSRRSKKKERIRVVTWDQPLTWFKFANWMEEEFGAVTVADYLGQATCPPIDTSNINGIVRGLAEDKLHLGMIKQAHGTLECTTEELETIIDEYSADCVIFNGHPSCKHAHAVKRVVMDICKEAGVAVLFMENDLYDNRVSSIKEVKNQIREFFKNSGLI